MTHPTSVNEKLAHEVAVAYDSVASADLEELVKAVLDEKDKEIERMREALTKINLGRHGELNEVQMALIAWEALNQSTKDGV